MSTSRREMHEQSREMAIREIEEVISARYRASNRPAPPPRELRQLAEDHYQKHRPDH